MDGSVTKVLVLLQVNYAESQRPSSGFAKKYFRSETLEAHLLLKV